VHNASNVHTFHAELSGNIRNVIVALPKASDFANAIPIGGRPPCDVLNQAHEELIFARCLDNDRWYCRFAGKLRSPSVARAGRLDPEP